ncbi:replication initiation protein [Paraclostridium sp. AKS46]|nr:replication initiation protein [Paraclostridium sp. AKS46]
MSNLTDIENPKILMKNNVLIQSKYSLTLNENRIFLLILYKLQKTIMDQCIVIFIMMNLKK